MAWTTFSVTPSASGVPPQSDDTDLMTNDNNGQTSFTFPANIVITDVVNSTVLTDTHQFAFQVNGVKSTSNMYTPATQPNSSGRISWADQKLEIPAGNSFAVSTSQKDGAVAEFFRIIVKYEPVRR